MLFSCSWASVEYLNDRLSAQELFSKLFKHPLSIDETTVRKHVSNICQHFTISNEEAEHYSLRDKLVELFTIHKPESVAQTLRDRFLTIPSIPNPDTPGRPIEIYSPFYVEFSEEPRCLEEIQKSGGLLRIRSPHKTGKTTLLHRIITGAEAIGYRTVSFNLSHDLDPIDCTNLAEFWAWYCKQVARELGLEEQTLPTRKQECTRYFQNNILTKIQMPLLLAIDEADLLFEYPNIARNFFPLLRSWHNLAKEPRKEIWKQLRLVIVHSTDDYCLLDQMNSPFENVGFVVRIPHFNAQNVWSLAKQYGLEWAMNTEVADAEVNRLMEMVGGHPYLIQQALYCLKMEDMSLEELLRSAPTLTGVYRSHLQALSDKLQASKNENRPEANLHQGLRQVIASNDNVQLTQEQTFKLEGLGLVQLQGNQVQLSCELYRLFFQVWFS
jgi:hypothetical protein